MKDDLRNFGNGITEIAYWAWEIIQTQYTRAIGQKPCWGGTEREAASWFLVYESWQIEVNEMHGRGQCIANLFHFGDEGWQLFYRPTASADRLCQRLLHELTEYVLRVFEPPVSLVYGGCDFIHTARHKVAQAVECLYSQTACV